MSQPSRPDPMSQEGKRTLRLLKDYEKLRDENDRFYKEIKELREALKAIAKVKYLDTANKLAQDALGWTKEDSNE